MDGSVYLERALAGPSELEQALARARRAQREWRGLPLKLRVERLIQFVDRFMARADQLSPELSWQMGRPVSQAPGELRGFAHRSRTMLELAPSALEPIRLDSLRRVQREPLGVVLTVAAWNYPYLIAVNSVVPALAAGNAVLLKHSAQTPLCAERLVEAGVDCLPEGLFQLLHMNHDLTARAVAEVDFVCFTGSVEGGRAVQRAASERFIGLGLELGGKDPAFVRSDADLEYTLENLVDGSFYNSGQSCCGIERIYVHQSLYEQFVEGFVERAYAYKLGNPLEPSTNLGPVVRASAAQAIQSQVDQAVARGARALIDPARFPAVGGAYLAPQVLVDVDHSMDLMTEETFGPVVGIMAVKNDEAAVRLMNDSRYGLTASIWTRDLEAADRLAQQVETGTLFANRCDYLDPELAWTGVKDSGRGCTLSRVGYEQLTRPKSFYYRRV